MKRPAFQFYPADWRKDPALSSCSLAARGLWIELMCVMHEAEPYGVMAVNGRSMDMKTIARMVGESPASVTRLLAELEAAGVFSRREDGAIYSRRMVKDEHIRNVRAEAGKKGGNPKLVGDLLKQKGKQATEQKPTPSSSSSSSSSSNTDSVSLDTSPKTDIPKELDTLRERARVVPTPTAAGEACIAMRKAGLVSTNPGHPKMLALLEAGATTAMFEHAAAIAVSRGKGFGYALGVLKGQMADAAKHSRQGNPEAIHDRNRTVAEEWLRDEELAP